MLSFDWESWASFISAYNGRLRIVFDTVWHISRMGMWQVWVVLLHFYSVD